MSTARQFYEKLCRIFEILQIIFMKVRRRCGNSSLETGHFWEIYSTRLSPHGSSALRRGDDGGGCDGLGTDGGKGEAVLCPEHGQCARHHEYGVHAGLWKEGAGRNY